ncbi:hypothetical protein [Arthrobacter bambusae]|uniref:Uncharacterized protein n=1 Tax=Arthrobacter bambusae TaxID=1338426 RepID=A0AAW8D8H5_9MICC|nr:hypothetical protein [Arthrobacter bambusae]MDP9904567.1 hypothetical protein [Arthrobacter bambusae]MDQ0129382.1 hypothetical protein [Arthrobacter bambusae]MDQ0181005.1 hypothetical protein [Arthrobacter bambusae]
MAEGPSDATLTRPPGPGEQDAVPERAEKTAVSVEEVFLAESVQVRSTSARTGVTSTVATAHSEEGEGSGPAWTTPWQQRDQGPQK